MGRIRKSCFKTRLLSCADQLVGMRANLSCFGEVLWSKMRLNQAESPYLPLENTVNNSPLWCLMELILNPSA